MVENETLFNIVIPSAIMVGLLAVNAAIFVVIMRYRKKK